MTETTELTGLEWDEADRIRKALRHANITNLQAAALLEVSKNSISNWVNGHARPRMRDLRAIAALTHVPVEWLRPEMTEPPTQSVGGQARPEGFEPPTFWLGVEQPGLQHKLDASKAVKRHRDGRV